MIIITGGAGFIGCNFIHEWLASSDELILNVDKLTYAGNLDSLAQLKDNEQYQFVHGSIDDTKLMTVLFTQYKPRALINFAAESHVDRSISGPAVFVETNVVGVFNLLEVAREFYMSSGLSPDDFKFLHVSTDEVFGSLEPHESAFTEQSPYKPNSAYSASKAASDHFVRAWFETYGLPTLITHCSNNYGPYQFPEKLIPVMVSNALSNKDLPVYGDGNQIRDWLHVADHCSAIRCVLDKGRAGETYNIGGGNELKNIELVHSVCCLLDNLSPRSDKLSYREQIKFVEDRLGHDRRYAINYSKIEAELAWSPAKTFEDGLHSTIEWYLNNTKWLERIATKEYMQTKW